MRPLGIKSISRSKEAVPSAQLFLELVRFAVAEPKSSSLSVPRLLRESLTRLSGQELTLLPLRSFSNVYAGFLAVFHSPVFDPYAFHPCVIYSTSIGDLRTFKNAPKKVKQINGPGDWRAALSFSR